MLLIMTESHIIISIIIIVIAINIAFYFTLKDSVNSHELIPPIVMFELLIFIILIFFI